MLFCFLGMKIRCLLLSYLWLLLTTNLACYATWMMFLILFLAGWSSGWKVLKSYLFKQTVGNNTSLSSLISEFFFLWSMSSCQNINLNSFFSHLFPIIILHLIAGKKKSILHLVLWALVSNYIDDVMLLIRSKKKKNVMLLIETLLSR